MARKNKGKVRRNKRVRFLSLDYYRYCCTGIMSEIQGIDAYYCTSDAIRIMFSNGTDRTYYVNNGEKQLKEVIKVVNAYIGGTGDGTQQ